MGGYISSNADPAIGAALRYAEAQNKKLSEEVDNVKLALKKKEKELQSLEQEHSMMLTNPSMKEMEKFYKVKLKKKDEELQQNKEELKSLKKRVAADMAVSLKTRGLESLNNPVSKTRLTEMYDNLKLLQWPKVTDQLKSSKLTPEQTKATIQEIFKDAYEEMKKKTQQIEEAFGLMESSNELATQKVKEYKQLEFKNLQMALFHTSKEDLLKTGLSECLGEFPEEVMVNMRALFSECYWLSCLMALNNPPVQPDWENLIPSMDPWDIFPQTIVEK